MSEFKCLRFFSPSPVSGALLIPTRAVVAKLRYQFRTSALDTLMHSIMSKTNFNKKLLIRCKIQTHKSEVCYIRFHNGFSNTGNQCTCATLTYLRTWKSRSCSTSSLRNAPRILRSSDQAKSALQRTTGGMGKRTTQSRGPSPETLGYKGSNLAL